MAEPFQSSAGKDVTPILASNGTNPAYVEDGDEPPPYRPPFRDGPYQPGTQIGQPTRGVAFNPHRNQMRSDADRATVPIVVQCCGLEIIEHNILTFLGIFRIF